MSATRVAALTTACVALLLALGAGGITLWNTRAGTLLLAPMIGGLEPCLLGPQVARAAVPPAHAKACDGPQGSAAAQVEASLAKIASPGTEKPGLALGYTLNIPLLKLLVREGDAWVVDRTAVERITRTVRDTNRPVVLYFFSNHFGVEAPIEPVLAQDPRNLLHTQDGPLPRDKYYGLIDIYPWSFVDKANDITRQRERVTAELLAALCHLPGQDRAKIAGVTLLGELHHMFPDFQGGMGFAGPYRISDYSATSVAGFRDFLKARFGGVAALNQALGASYPSFAAVLPPARDIRRETLANYGEHLDAHAHGVLPVNGWVHVPGGAGARVRVYRNGVLAGDARVGLSRQDVLQAHPEFGTAEVGWSYDLRHAGLPRGIHQLDVYLELPGQPLQHLGARRIAILDATRQPALPLPVQALPASVPAPAGLQFSLDFPAEMADFYYNPLVPLWHAYRQSQIEAYLAHFRALVARSCLGGERVYSHQILPFANPGWDVNKFATGTNLAVPREVALGVSLYGEASYGASFADWLRQSRRARYGITEFHPLRAMTARELGDVMRLHRQRGAAFLSFFVAADGADDGSASGANLFAFDPNNRKFGSDVLYESAREAIRK